MPYRKLQAEVIFDGTNLFRDKVLVLDQQGTILDLISSNETGEQVEKLKGILLPGFINAHCHLELSHLKGVIPVHTGLVDFLLSVVDNRQSNTFLPEADFEKAAEEMYVTGTSAVADISNTIQTLPVKKKNNKIHWYNMVEVINFRDDKLNEQLQHYSNLVNAYRENEFRSELVPHAPYSVSDASFDVINEATEGKIISIHNQETSAENELFQFGTGGFLKLYGRFASPVSPFPVSGRSSLQTWLPHFTRRQTIVLVHNTFISGEDIDFAASHALRYGLRLYYCLCPNANRYIENRLPPVQLLREKGCRIILGTDSYSSNWQLNIASEIATIRQHFPTIPLQEILQWATSIGASAFGWKQLGRFEKGHTPGVILMNENDFGVRRLA